MTTCNLFSSNEEVASGKSRPYSIVNGRDYEVLRLMLGFYGWPGAQVIDVTANTRKMWKGVDWPSVTFSDIDPSVAPDIIADFRALPVEDESFDIVVFDPPHLPAAAASPASDKRFVANYGLSFAPKADNVSEYHAPFLSEAKRILRSDGLIFTKIKDYVHNHKYQWSLVDFITAVRAQEGLTACDLIIKRDPSGGGLKSGRWERAHHVRNCHCWWVIVRKGRCEPRKR